MNSSAPLKRISILTVISIIAWGIVSFLGYHGPKWMENDLCFRYFGCNAGFFGYDALLHVLSGIMEAAVVVWFSRKYAGFNLLTPTFWKNAFITVAIVGLIAGSWEVLEFGHDHLKFIATLSPDPSRLDQPSNADTVGDIAFTILGGIAGVGLLKSLEKKS